MIDHLKDQASRYKNKGFINLKKMWIKKVDGLGVVEIILIIVVIIALVIIFRDQLTSIIKSIFERITGEVTNV